MRDSDPHSHEGNAKRRRPLRVAGILAAVLIGVVGVRPLLQILLPVRIEIGPDTTVINGPLTPEGRVDYVAAMNQRLADGVTPENNSAVPLVRAFGPEIIDDSVRAMYFEQLGIEPPPPGGDYIINSVPFFRRKHDPRAENAGELRSAWDDRLMQAQTRPWSPDEFPDIAEWLDANTAPLELVIQATTRPRFFSPLIVTSETSDSPQLLMALLPLQQAARDAARLLVTRAMLHLHRGETDAAWNDLLACHRLARLLGQSGTTIGQLIGYAVDAIACDGNEQLLRHGRLNADQARQSLADLDALTPLPRSVDALDVAERFTAIDAIQSMSDEHTGMDWNLMLRMLNEHFDDLVDALRQQRYADRLRRDAELSEALDKRIDETRQPLNLVIGTIVDRRQMISEHTGLVHLALFTPALSAAHTAEVRSTARLHLTPLGFALAAWHADRGKYPESLDELAPDYLPKIPLDPFVDKPFRYEPAENSYRLYSLGDNMADDNGRTYDSDPRGDDILIEIPPPQAP